ncbi:cytochrome c-type biogenesis protein F2 [Salmonella enterica subsp. arizonae]|uniref:Cytochrome c-type biogenesis protein F2 n=1 Tax=Salmonella enterica subsp. arizonae TaxID=59203 RepID=A0A379RXK5_SALER|nr:cytochrome c-type biogenesis protein F2 [Salmonella enterica subsp. arizonae]
MRWGRDRPRKIRNLLLVAFITTLLLSVLLPWLLQDRIAAMTVAGMAMACWIAVLAVAEAVQRVSRGTRTSFSYWGDGGGAPRAGGDDYRHRLPARITALSAMCG